MPRFASVFGLSKAPVDGSRAHRDGNQQFFNAL
jgi:hypothetical protein